MKIKLDALGFTNSKKLKISEGLITTGLTLAAAGMLLLVRSQEWNIGHGKDAYEYFESVWQEIHK